ncbi:hypothetical protein ACQPWW_09495 [Micromonospora sp. CA-240977]|uniref:hypothetical protein n=1 Tax=Micromonospora sp. CA-240977 TaxID=3239957 RepID=UPI003D9077F2
MKTSRTRIALVASMAAPLVLALTPGTAFAADGNDGYVWACWAAPGDSINGGCATFYQYGEVLQVRDMQADGWGTRGQIQKLQPDSSGVMHWVNHSSDCFDDTSQGNSGNGATACNYSLPEGIVVRVHVWASRNGETRYHNYSPEIRA